MIVAEFFRKNGEIMGFKINGHAGCGEFGEDIACASVSSAVQMTANLITEIFGYQADISVLDNDIILKTSISDDKTLQNLYNGFILQLDLLSQEFKKTIRTKFTEV